MSAHLLLNDLLSQGLRLLADGDKLRVRGRLTDELRQQIRAHKAKLLALLTENQAATTAQEATSAPTPASLPFLRSRTSPAPPACTCMVAHAPKELVQGGQEGGR